MIFTSVNTEEWMQLSVCMHAVDSLWVETKPYFDPELNLSIYSII